MAHESAHKHFAGFLVKYIPHGPFHLLDVGGDGGTYLHLTEHHGGVYTCLDMSEHANVNVTDSPYIWPLPDNTFDAVASSSTFEHIEFPWMTFMEMVRVCKPGGLIYINVPSAGPRHWDRDYWRFQKDSMLAFANWGHVRLVESSIDVDGGDPTWQDVVGIFCKRTP